MKWTICMITLNGAEYIWYSLKSVIDFIKEMGGQIIIIEGSTKYADNLDEEGNSKDDTTEIIKGFIKDTDSNFIIYRKIGRVADKKVLRNAYFEEIKKLPKENQPDWILVLDDDELYKIEDLRRLDTFLTNNPDIEYIFNPQRWFWKDFKTEAYSSENESLKQIIAGDRKDQLFFDCIGNRLRQGQYHERIFKWSPGLSYANSHSVITDKDGKDVYIHPDYESRRIVFSGCPRYHYGYLTTTERMNSRYQYYERRDKFRIPKDPEELWRDNYGHYLLRNIPKNTCTRIRPYYGKHPIIIEQHPYWKEGLCPMAKDSQKKVISNDFSWSYETLTEDGKTLVLYRHEYVLDKLKPNSKILDVGGLGRFAKRLAEEGHIVTVLNADKYDIKTKDDRVTYRYGDIYDPPLSNDTKFDYINCSETLEHIKDKERAIYKMHKLLEEGGALFGSVPIFGSVPMAGNYKHKTDVDKSDFNIERVEKLLATAGFKNIKVMKMGSMKKENKPSVYWFWGEKNGI